MERMRIGVVIGLVLVIMSLTDAFGRVKKPKFEVAAGEKSGFSLVGKVGYFMPGDSDIEDLTGGGLTFGGGVKMNILPELSLLGTIEYWLGKYAESVSVRDYGYYVTLNVDSSLTIIPKCITAIYNIPTAKKGLVPYIGAGIGHYSAKWEMQGETRVGGSLFSFNFSESKSAVGFHVVAGVDSTISQEVSMYVDFKFASAEIDDWDDMEVGGTTLGTGVRFLF